MTRQDIERNVKEMPLRDLQNLYAIGLLKEKTDPKFDKLDSEILEIMRLELVDRFVDQAEILI